MGATVGYSFIPAEPFAGRPFGLSINLAYRNLDGRSFSESVFNETVNIVEVDEGLDGETFFLYLFFALVSFSCSSWVNKPSPLWVNDEEVLQGWRLELPGTPATYLMMVSTTIGFLRKL